MSANCTSPTGRAFKYRSDGEPFARWCPWCKTWKGLRLFSPAARMPHGVAGHCKPCRAAIARERGYCRKVAS